jgi:hypothetical protein
VRTHLGGRQGSVCTGRRPVRRGGVIVVLCAGRRLSVVWLGWILRRQRAVAGDEGARGGRWWADEPITSPAEDELGRRPFVAQIGRLLEQIRASPSSTVLGLVGPWGSGKTSTLNLVIDGLDRQLWGVTQVNPWALSGPDAVVAELLAAVGAALPGKGRIAGRARRA